MGAIVGGAAKAGADALADTLAKGSKWVIETTVGWWLNIPSIDLAKSGAPTMRQNLLYLSLVVAVGGVMWGGLRMAFRRNAEPAWDIGTGLLRLASVSALGVVVPQLLLRAGDSFSTWILDTATSDQVAQRLSNVASMGGVAAPGAIILAAIVMIVAGVIQALAMFLREGGIIILTGVLVLSSAGGFNAATKSWFPKVSGWLVALILYKPMAALVYAAALTQVGSEANDPRNLFIGLAMMILAIVALPTMMKFFTWAAPGAVNAASGRGGGAAALAGGAMAAAALRSGSGSRTPADQAAAINRSLGPVNGSGGGGGGGRGGGPDGAGTGSPLAGVATRAAAAKSAAAGGGGAAAGAGEAGTAAAAAGGPVGVAVLAAGAAKKTASAASTAAGGAMSGGGGPE